MLAGALVVGVLADRLKIPYTVALVVAGLAVSFNRMASPVDFGGSLLFWFLPPLLFEAAWNIRVDALRRTWMTIAWLAVPGVILTLVVVAAFMVPFAELSWSSALVLGAILSATDPVAVIALFRRVRVPLELQTIVEGESLANDGIAAVLVAGFVALAAGRGGLSIPAMIGEALFATVGGIVVGIALAYLVQLLVRGARDAEMQTVATILVAYGAYIVAVLAQVSGIFATVSAGIALRALAGARAESAESIDTFWGVVAFLANSLVFLLMGLTIQIDRLAVEPLLLGGTIVAILVSRALTVYGMPPFRELGAGWRRLIGLAGIRGGLALALALSLPAQIAHRAEIIDAVFAGVLFTVVVQGLAIGPYTARYGGNLSGGRPLSSS